MVAACKIVALSAGLTRGVNRAPASISKNRKNAQRCAKFFRESPRCGEGAAGASPLADPRYRD
jgi:hypothetical protein